MFLVRFVNHLRRSGPHLRARVCVRLPCLVLSEFRPRVFFSGGGGVDARASGGERDLGLGGKHQGHGVFGGPQLVGQVRRGTVVSCSVCVSREGGGVVGRQASQPVGQCFMPASVC